MQPPSPTPPDDPASAPDEGLLDGRPHDLAEARVRRLLRDNPVLREGA